MAMNELQLSARAYDHILNAVRTVAAVCEPGCQRPDCWPAARYGKGIRSTPTRLSLSLAFAVTKPFASVLRPWPMLFLGACSDSKLRTVSVRPPATIVPPLRSTSLVPLTVE